MNANINLNIVIDLSSSEELLEYQLNNLENLMFKLKTLGFSSTPDLEPNPNCLETVKI